MNYNQAVIRAKERCVKDKIAAICVFIDREGMKKFGVKEEMYSTKNAKTDDLFEDDSVCIVTIKGDIWRKEKERV